MTQFEFVMVLVGLVGAISISVILTYLGHVTRNWQHTKNPILFLLLAAWMIFNVIGYIGGIWAYRFVDLEIQLSAFIVIAPIIFFTLAVTTFIPPKQDDGKEIDLDKVYFASSRAVFILLAVHESTALAVDYLPGVTGAPPALFMLTMIVIFLVATLTQHKLAHYVLLLLLLASQALPLII